MTLSSLVRNRYFSIGLGIAAALVLAFVQFGLPAYRAYREHAIRTALAADPRTSGEFSNLAKAEEFQKKHPDDPQGYLSVGLVWKTFGDATGDRRYYTRSRDTYMRGVELFGEKNTIVTLNAAHLEKILGNYTHAEELYKMIIRVNPGQTEPYIELVELYRYNMADTRTDRDIINTYREGLAKVLTNGDIVQSLAYYLKDMKRYRDSLVYFRILYKAFPGDHTIPLEIDEAEKAIARGEDRSTGDADVLAP